MKTVFGILASLVLWTAAAGQTAQGGTNAEAQKAVEIKPEKPKLDTTVFLKRSADNKEWADGGWGVGSHTGAMAYEIFRAVCDGQTDLISDLEKGIANILSHQCPADGLWGPPEAQLGVRIGGTLKVIGRLGFYLGMKIPRTKELADSLIANQKNGRWKEAAKVSGECAPRNAIEMAAFCLEASDYRREELHAAMEGIAMDMRMFDTPDYQRNTIEYACGMAADYLNWTGCLMSNPTRGFERGLPYEYKIVLQDDGKTVKVVRKDPTEKQKAWREHILATIAAARRKQASPCPAWVNDLPGKRYLHNVELLKKQLERRKETGEPWGYGGDEVATVDLWNGAIGYYGSLDKAPGFTPQIRQELIRFYQGWQDPITGRFHTWKQPKRICNDKYVMALLDMLKAKPLYPWTMNDKKTVETKQEKK